MKNGRTYRGIRFSITGSAIASPVLLTVVLLVFLSIHPTAALAAIESGYSLIGTIRSKNFTGAVIGVGNNKQLFFRLGDDLPDGSRIVDVGPDTIHIKDTDGTTREMFINNQTTLAASPSSPPVAGQEVRTRPGEHIIDKYQRRYGNRIDDD